jgi:hypothetical protein
MLQSDMLRQPLIEPENPFLFKADSRYLPKLGSTIYPTPSNLWQAKLGGHYGERTSCIHHSLMGGEGTPAGSSLHFLKQNSNNYFTNT